MKLESRTLDVEVGPTYWGEEDFEQCREDELDGKPSSVEFQMDNLRNIRGYSGINFNFSFSEVRQIEV